MFKEIVIEEQNVTLRGHLSAPDEPKAWVIFAHGSGSSRKSTRNNWVAGELNKRGFGTFLFDLLTVEEDSVYENRFDIPLLATRLLAATRWLMNGPYYNQTPIAYFGASTGAGAALIAAAKADRAWPLFTVISRGGRPDLAYKENLNVKVPVLLIVGGLDYEVIQLNESAQRDLKRAKLKLVDGATHLFEEPGALNEVVELSGDWLERHLPREEEELRWAL